MCSRTTIRTKTVHRLAQQMGLFDVTTAALNWRHPHPGMGEVQRGDTIPMVTTLGGNARIDIARFGFSFEWSTNLVTNARADGIDTRKTWGPLFSHNRCVVPVMGFWEWNKRLHCYTIFSLDKMATQVMYLAGLYGVTGKDGSKSMAVITTEPNEVVSRVHNRMPVILTGPMVDQWLDYGPKLNRWQLKELLVPYQGELCKDDLLAA